MMSKLGLPTYTLEQGEKRLAMINKWRALNDKLDAAKAAERAACAARNAVQMEMAKHHDELWLLEDQMGERHSVMWLDSLYGPKRLPPNAEDQRRQSRPLHPLVGHGDGE